MQQPRQSKYHNHATRQRLRPAPRSQHDLDKRPLLGVVPIHRQPPHQRQRRHALPLALLPRLLLLRRAVAAAAAAAAAAVGAMLRAGRGRELEWGLLWAVGRVWVSVTFTICLGLQHRIGAPACCNIAAWREHKLFPAKTRTHASV